MQSLTQKQRRRLPAVRHPTWVRYRTALPRRMQARRRPAVIPRCLPCQNQM